MIIALLCGGAGTRFNNTFPKPLNLINGLPMIYHVITHLQVTSLHIIYNKTLKEYGFCQYLINTFQHITFHFNPIDFQTRGPAETLYLGLSKLPEEEQILVLDNDTIYKNIDFTHLPTNSSFLLYNDNHTGLHHYSFIQVNPSNQITNIQERIPLSNHICIGGYGFRNVAICKQYCKDIIMQESQEEPYLSRVMKRMLDQGEEIQAHYCPEVFSVGTPKDIQLNLSQLTSKKLRCVFDLDNTLVTYPNTYKNYQTVSPIQHTIDFIHYLKEQGHEIIIYTARNMVTAKHNVGKAMKNIAATTLQTLTALNIPYDEIHFGKPYGDIYIDDKAFNPYNMNLMEELGFYNYNSKLLSSNYLTNKYNQITRINQNQIQKSGADLSGEAYYYSMIKLNPSLEKFFPHCYSHDNNNNITLSYINGTSLAKIYYEGLVQPFLIEQLILTTHTLHHTHIKELVTLTPQDIHDHYMIKFETRSQQTQDFPFPDFQAVYQRIKENTLTFLKQNYPLNPIIHGDLWFSNIMYYKSHFVFYDMRGKFNNQNTLQGHTFYDLAKLYQSIVGLDAIVLYNSHLNKHIRQTTEALFWKAIDTYYHLTPEEHTSIKQLTAYLIYNTFHAYDTTFELSKKEKIWELVKELLHL